MYFINEEFDQLLLQIVDDNNKPVRFGGDYITLNQIKQLTVIGKASMHDNHITAYIDKKSLTFIGNEPVKFKESFEDAAIYMLANDEGVIFFDKTDNQAYLSRSIYQLINYCLNIDIDILKIVYENAVSGAFPSKHIINNDFSIRKITGENISADDMLSFDMLWHSSSSQLEFEMLIEQVGYKINKGNMFFTEYTGQAVNIGKFRKIALNPLEDGDRIPDFFPELDLNDCIVFTELLDDNAQSVLVPNVMTLQHYKNLIQEMRSIDRKKLSTSATSRFGYGVQVEIELLDESETTTDYQAKINRLIITPYDTPMKTFL